jgi:glycosyltransferase involved in cell wall biosynthesis
MKILLVSSSSGSRGGGELFLLYLGEALARRGHEVTLWASDHPRMDELCAAFARIGPVRRADYRNTYDLPGRSLAAFTARRKPRELAAQWRGFDCVHVNKQNLEDGLDLLRAARLAGVPTLGTIHLTQSAVYLRAVGARLRDFVSRGAIAAYPGALVAVAESRAQDLAAFLGDASRVHTIPNGVPLPDLSLRPSRGAGLLVVGVGRLVPQKRPFVFLDVAQKIHAELPEARFRWVGDGALATEWDRAVAGRGLADVLTRTGWQSDVRPHLIDADVFLHTAEYEGLPLAILEAMAAGLPCLVTENLRSDLPFLDEGNSLGIGADGRWLAQLKDRALLVERGAAARRLVAERFSWGRMAESYERLYHEAVEIFSRHV